MMLQASPALQPNVVLICSAQSEKKIEFGIRIILSIPRSEREC